MIKFSNTNNEEFKPDNLDLILALISTFLLPVIATLLYMYTGAFLALVAYYVIFCYLLVNWRKGSLEYQIPSKIITPLFIIFVVFEIVKRLLSTQTIVHLDGIPIEGFLFTLIIWATINAFSEQLIWIYVYDSFALYFDEGRNKTIFSILGLILYFTLIGLIHVLFWSQFLLESDSIFPWTQILLASQFVTAVGYLVVYKTSKSMVPVFFLHLLADVGALLLSGYSIIPYLFKF